MAENDDPRSSRGEDTSGRPTTRSVLSTVEAIRLKDVLGAVTLAGYDMRIETGRKDMELGFGYLHQVQKIPGHADRMERLAELDTAEDGKIGQLCELLEELLKEKASRKRWRETKRWFGEVVGKSVLGVVAATFVAWLLQQLGSWGNFAAWIGSQFSKGGPHGGGD